MYVPDFRIELDSRRARRLVIIIIALFVAAALPFAFRQLLTANFDEPRYTYSAAKMMETGDYIVPLNPWGGPRLLKPPLAYYFVVAGFGLFGESLFGTKIFWIVGAAGVLYLTFALARRIGAGPAGAAIAVAALAGNLIFFQSALTHIPDIPLMLGLTLALIAATALLRPSPPPWSYYAFWFGLAAAILSKGLFALGVLAIVLALRLRCRGLARPSGHEIVAMAIAVPLSASWYIATYLALPEAFVTQFVGDQITGKTTFGPAHVLDNLSENVFDLLLGFVPFLLLLPVAPLRRLARRPRPEVMFLWIILAYVIVLFAFTQFRSERYMLPAMPALAALIGLTLGQAEPGKLARAMRRVARLLLVFPAILCALSAGVLYAGMGLLPALALAALAVVGAVALWRGVAGERLGRTLILLAVIPSWSVLAVYPAYRVLGVPSASDTAVARIEAMGIENRDVLIVSRFQLIERIGLAHPPIEDFRFALQPTPAALAGAKLVIATRPEDQAALEARGYQVETTYGPPGAFPFSALVTAIRSRDLAGLRARYGEPMYLAVPPG